MNDYTDKWSVSNSEEYWAFEEVYDTREEAVAAVPEYCREYDIDHAFVGEADVLTFDGLLTTVDVECLVEAMDEHGFDNAGCEETVVEIKQAQIAALRQVIVDWMDSNLDPIAWHVVNKITEVRG